MPNLSRVRGGGGSWIEKKRILVVRYLMKPFFGIEILFKEKDIKYLEFRFVYYMDDPIRKDHDWELFDRLSLRKRRNRINLNSGPLFEILYTGGPFPSFVAKYQLYLPRLSQHHRRITRLWDHFESLNQEEEDQYGRKYKEMGHFFCVLRIVICMGDKSLVKVMGKIGEWESENQRNNTPRCTTAEFEVTWMTVRPLVPTTTASCGGGGWTARWESERPREKIKAKFGPQKCRCFIHIPQQSNGRWLRGKHNPRRVDGKTLSTILVFLNRTPTVENNLVAENEEKIKQEYSCSWKGVDPDDTSSKKVPCKIAPVAPTAGAAGSGSATCSVAADPIEGSFSALGLPRCLLGDCLWKSLDKQFKAYFNIKNAFFQVIESNDKGKKKGKLFRFTNSRSQHLHFNGIRFTSNTSQEPKNELKTLNQKHYLCVWGSSFDLTETHLLSNSTSTTQFSMLLHIGNVPCIWFLKEMCSAVFLPNAMLFRR
ncbi:hypothetical protein DH2020_045410 [Rehmannia glutinosa]|uniref:Ycf2 N-terminal domain-containing protein n=1 Tax=Rehmannia glutinosa TaxID=99300 RepID=A0ABR0UE75_REHGL